MKHKNKKYHILSFIVGICFLITYFLTKEVIGLILGFIWTLIGIEYLREYRKI